MKKAILKILMANLIILLMFFSCFPTNATQNVEPPWVDTTSDNVILRDDFNNLSSHWYWLTKHTGYHSINDGIAEFKIPKATCFDHFVAEIMDNCSPPYKYNNMKVRVRVEPIVKGSSGWGFWNGQLNPSDCCLAWFIYHRASPLYPMNRLWIMCMDGSLQNMTIKRIRGYDIREWHEYEINWTEDNINFYIDGDQVAHVAKGIPHVSCRADIWIDNTVWYFFPVHQMILRPTTLYLDYIEITK